MPDYEMYFDTKEGEVRYSVQITDEEQLGTVLREILVELTEMGHILKGPVASSLKVICDGRELDPSRRLPEQGVRPHQVLRVILDEFQVGANSVRQDRIEGQWQLLQELAQLNPQRIGSVERRSSCAEDAFHWQLTASPGVSHAQLNSIEVSLCHRIRLRYPRFYPEVPPECYLETAAFHPNICPDSRFVCLWAEARPRDCILRIAVQLQAMLAYRLLAPERRHLLNRAAAEWYEAFGRVSGGLPLDFRPLRVDGIRADEMVWLDPEGPGLAGLPRESDRRLDRSGAEEGRSPAASAPAS